MLSACSSSARSSVCIRAAFVLERNYCAMSVELMFVLEIEKHQCLYNFRLAEYSRKDITEKAWGEVAAKTELSVPDCKEKWRNIRSSFLRSMKPSAGGSKVKKPYYLKDCLKFLLPFIRPLNTKEIQPPESETQTTYSEVNDSYSEESQLNDDYSMHEVASTLLSTIARQLKHQTLEGEKPSTDYLKLKNRSSQTEEVHQQFGNESVTDYDPMRYFLMSLLPEFETTTEDQIREFKIRVMILIDEIKLNYSQLRQTPYYSDSGLPGASQNSFVGKSRRSFVRPTFPVSIEEDENCLTKRPHFIKNKKHQRDSVAINENPAAKRRKIQVENQSNSTQKKIVPVGRLSSQPSDEILIFVKSISSQMKSLPKSVCKPLLRDIQNLIESKMSGNGFSISSDQSLNCDEGLCEEVFIKSETDFPESDIDIEEEIMY